MRLCDERRLWFPILHPIGPPRRTRRQRKRQNKNEKPPPEKIQVILGENGERTVFVERPKSLRRSKQDNNLRVPDNSEAEDDDMTSCQDISTQTTVHDLEFLLTDPRNRRQSVREISSDTNDKDKIIYKRGEVDQQTYKTQLATLDVRHETVNRTVVNVSSNGRAAKDEQTMSDDSITSTLLQMEEVALHREENKIKKAPSCSRRVEKPSETQLTMVRVGGGWMELPDYLRYHKPMSVQEQKVVNSEETNMIIRSQRPRTASSTNHSSRPSWTATLSRGTRGCGSTVLRQRLI